MGSRGSKRKQTGVDVGLIYTLSTPPPHIENKSVNAKMARLSDHGNLEQRDRPQSTGEDPCQRRIRPQRSDQQFSAVRRRAGALGKREPDQGIDHWSRGVRTPARLRRTAGFHRENGGGKT